MCLADGSTAARLQRRRNVLQQFFASSESTLLSSTDPPVWVEGSLLRRFFSCADGLEGLLRGTSPILRHERLLCNHEQPGLHPRVVRKGKLLPQPLYNLYVHLLASERAELEFNAASLSIYENGAADCVITPETGMFCKLCSQSYSEELSGKLEKLKVLRYLYDELDPKKDEIHIHASPSDEEDQMRDLCLYAVSRRFISKFRGHVGSVLRSLEDAQKLQAKGDSSTSILDGLDGVDLSWLESTLRSRQISFSDEKDVLDPFVNSNITCTSIALFLALELFALTVLQITYR